MADVFDDDVTQPIQRNPGAQGPPVFHGEGAPGPAPDTTPPTIKGPPAFDPFADDVTITVGRSRPKDGVAAPEPVAEQLLDLRDGASSIPDTSPRLVEPLTPPATASQRWTPPSRPNAPGPATTRVDRRRTPLWTFVVAALVLAVLTFVLVYRVIGG